MDETFNPLYLDIVYAISARRAFYFLPKYLDNFDIFRKYWKIDELVVQMKSVLVCFNVRSRLILAEARRENRKLNDLLFELEISCINVITNKKRNTIRYKIVLC